MILYNILSLSFYDIIHSFANNILNRYYIKTLTITKKVLIISIIYSSQGRKHLIILALTVISKGYSSLWQYTLLL